MRWPWRLEVALAAGRGRLKTARRSAPPGSLEHHRERELPRGAGTSRFAPWKSDQSPASAAGPGSISMVGMLMDPGELAHRGLWRELQGPRGAQRPWGHATPVRTGVASPGPRPRSQPLPAPGKQDPARQARGPLTGSGLSDPVSSGGTSVYLHEHGFSPVTVSRGSRKTSLRALYCESRSVSVFREGTSAKPAGGECAASHGTHALGVRGRVTGHGNVTRSAVSSIR